MLSGGISRRREAALVATLAVVTAVALTYPLAFQLGDGGRVDSEDGLFSIWNVAWVARTIVADPADLFHANIFYPHRNALAFSEANLVAGLMAVPPYWLTRNPYTAHNTVVLWSFMLSLVGAYLLVRRLTGSRSAAAVSGVLFAFCPFVFARSAHIQRKGDRRGHSRGARPWLARFRGRPGTNHRHTRFDVCGSARGDLLGLWRGRHCARTVAPGDVGHGSERLAVLGPRTTSSGHGRSRRLTLRRTPDWSV